MRVKMTKPRHTRCTLLKWKGMVRGVGGYESPFDPFSCSFAKGTSVVKQ
jgi:hypothetical protein